MILSIYPQVCFKSETFLFLSFHMYIYCRLIDLYSSMWSNNKEIKSITFFIRKLKLFLTNIHNFQKICLQIKYVKLNFLQQLIKEKLFFQYLKFFHPTIIIVILSVLLRFSFIDIAILILIHPNS